MSAVGKGQTVDLGDGYQIRELSVPAHLAGRSLRDLALRERTEMQVLLEELLGIPIPVEM